MAIKQNYKGLSNRAKYLLSIEEGYEVDFKENLKGLSSEDFVSFANSLDGGAILIGIAERKGLGGNKEIQVVGCKTGDEEKLIIHNKAKECNPSVRIEVFVENENDKPFYRIEIPSGKQKPYCTSKGTFKIRNDNQNKPLLPGELLAMFLSVESGKFLQNFEEATLEMREELEEQNQSIMNKIMGSAFDMEDRVSEMIREMETSFLNISDEIKDTESEISTSLESIKDENEIRIENTEAIQDEIREQLIHLIRRVQVLEVKSNLLLKKFDIEDPEITRTREDLKFYYSNLKGIHLERDEKMGEEWFEEEYKKHAVRSAIVQNFFDVKDIQKIYNELEPHLMENKIKKRRGKVS